MKQQELLELITIDFSGFHGPVASALVTDNGTPFDWLESVHLIGYYCESEWHTERECDCVTEETLKAAALEHYTERGLTLVGA